MLKRISTIITAGGAAAAVAVALGAAPSSATTATTWSVKPGGSTTASGSIQLYDPKTENHVLWCKSVKLVASLKSGSGLAGVSIGSITSDASTGCALTKPHTFPLSITAKGLPWRLNTASYRSGVTTGTITGIDLLAQGVGCRTVLDSTTAGANKGMIRFTYANPTGKLKFLLTGGNLHFWDISGCLGLFNNGDPAEASGTLTMKPQQTITSP